jgi:hypothetical protein
LVVFVAYDFFNALQNYFAGKKYCLFIFMTALKMLSYTVKLFFLEPSAVEKSVSVKPFIKVLTV